MIDAPTLILASGSAIRRRLLEAAGVSFQIIRPDVDEAAIKDAAVAEGLTIEAVAQRLAEAKATAAPAPPGAIVIGSDQILEWRGRAFDKPRDLGEAKERLLRMQADRHKLINATVLAVDGDIVWRHLERPSLSLRPLTEPEVDAYIAAAGPDILSSVAAYQVEALGARLFERIEGDYFAVLGLALFPLLAALRDRGALPF